MINKIIELEQARLKGLGYDSIVTPISINVTSNLTQSHLGNSTMLLTGIRISDKDIINDISEVCISSATESLQLTQQHIASLGTSVNKLFKEYIVIKTTTDEEFSNEQEILPYRLDFIRISPLKK